MRFIPRPAQIRIAEIDLARWKKSVARRKGLKAVVPEQPLVIVPPTHCNFSTDYTETVEFLLKLKTAALADGQSHWRRRIRVEMSKIENISLAAALVLSAEFDRWRLLKARRLVPTPDDWHPQVLQVLQQLGFFGLLATKAPPLVPQSQRSDFTVLHLVSCDTADGRKVRAISDHLKTVAEILQQNPVVYEAMFEAAYNSVLHAYPETYPFKFPPIRNRWWATARWSTTENEVSFLVYDQGVGIAETLPRWHLWEHIVTQLTKLAPIGSHFFKEHATMINAALEVSRTSRDGGHGQGLSDIVAPIEALNAGRLRIISGKGEVIVYPGGRTVLTERELHIGGTLVEWRLPVQP